MFARCPVKTRRLSPKESELEVKTAIAERDAAIERGYAFSPKSLAKHFGVHHSRVRATIRSGALPAFRLGSILRIRPERISDEVLAIWLRPAKGVSNLPTGPLVYFLVGTPGFVKIGYTRNLAARVIDLQVGCPAPLELAAWVAGPPSLEREYHNRFATLRCAGEWFKLEPAIQAEIDHLNDTPKEPHHD
jgi:hypothetical protein